MGWNKDRTLLLFQDGREKGSALVDGLLTFDRSSRVQTHVRFPGGQKLVLSEGDGDTFLVKDERGAVSLFSLSHPEALTPLTSAEAGEIPLLFASTGAGRVAVTLRRETAIVRFLDR